MWFLGEDVLKRHYRFVKWVGGFILVTLLLLAIETRNAKATQTLDPLSQSELPGSPQEAMLTGNDLPGFRQAAESEAAGFLTLAKRMTTGLLSPQTKIANLSMFRSTNLFRPEYVISFTASPVTEREELTFDALADNPQNVLETLRRTAQISGNAENPRILSELGGIGGKSMGFSMTIGLAPVDQQVGFLWVRRGEIIQSTWVFYPTGGTPSIDLHRIGLLVDQRVVERFTGTIFRPAGPLVPEITTHIPTPLDVSTRPSVIATNLFLAALMMLPFAVAAETFTRLSAENEELLRDKFRPVRWILNLQNRLAGFLNNRSKPRSAGASILNVLWITLFYGLVFSLLDRTWNPFSLTGLVLFLNMTVAYGIVGIADDIIQWRILKKWGEPANLTLRPTNILIATISTVTSRLLTLVPGLMFGTPEALVVDEVRLGKKRRNTLLKISAYTLLTVGFGLWALTTITAFIQRQNIPVTFGDVIGGLEGFLLVVFAVALENTFVQMLGLPGSFGEALRKRSRWLWLLGLVGITFVFYHTLINPRGELAAALQESNVWIFLGVAGAFVGLTFGLWAYVRLKGRKPIASPSSTQSRSKKGKQKQLIPAWVWLALSIIGVTVVGVILVAEREEGIQASLQPTAGQVAAAPTAAPAPSTGTGSQGPVAFNAPRVVQKLCYATSVDITKDVTDLYLWRGVQLTAAEYGAQAIYSVPLTTNEAGYTSAIDQLIQEDCSLIVGNWSYQQNVFRTAANEHPAQKFMLGGYSAGIRPDLPNLWVTEYRMYEGAYLAGYLAAAASKNGRVGTYGGIDDPTTFSSVNCFALGVYNYSKSHSGKTEILGWDPNVGKGLLAGSLTDPNTGASISNELISQGADILFPVAGLGGASTGYGSAVAARQHPGVTIIGNELNWAWAMPESSNDVFTSVEARYDTSIAIAADALVKGEFHGAKHEGSLASGEIAFTPLNSSLKQIPSDLNDELVQEEKSAVIDICGHLPQVWGFLNLDSVGGWGWHANAQMTIRAFASPGGGLLFTGTAMTDQTGQFGQNIGVDVVPGMALELTDGTDTASATLDPLTVELIDEKNNIVSGTATAGAKLSVFASDGGPGIAINATADENGRWKVDFTGQFDLSSKTFVQAMLPGTGKNMTIIKIGPNDKSK